MSSCSSCSNVAVVATANNEVNVKLLKCSLSKINEAKIIQITLETAFKKSIEYFDKIRDALEKLCLYLYENKATKIYADLQAIQQTHDYQQREITTMISTLVWNNGTKLNDIHIEYSFHELDVSETLLLFFPLLTITNPFNACLPLLDIGQRLYAKDIVQIDENHIEILGDVSDKNVVLEDIVDAKTITLFKYQQDLQFVSNKFDCLYFHEENIALPLKQVYEFIYDTDFEVSIQEDWTIDITTILSPSSICRLYLRDTIFVKYYPLMTIQAYWEEDETIPSSNKKLPIMLDPTIENGQRCVHVKKYTKNFTALTRNKFALSNTLTEPPIYKCIGISLENYPPDINSIIANFTIYYKSLIDTYNLYLNKSYDNKRDVEFIENMINLQISLKSTILNCVC